MYSGAWSPRWLPKAEGYRASERSMFFMAIMNFV
jgi:hypothetical protein